MFIQTRPLEYEDGSERLIGQISWDTDATSPRPGILVAHAWGGCGDFESKKAYELAKLGYSALAVDMYGEGRTGSSKDENAKLMQPFLEDRGMLQRRMQAALDTLKAQDCVDESRTGAIGFCFGGLCVLDLARTGADIGAAVSFHGILAAPDNLEKGPIGARILVLHGWDDPMATPDAVVALGQELTEAGADWQLHGYGGTMHAFTNPHANDPGFGTVYSESADRRSWVAMQNFFEETLGGG